MRNSRRMEREMGVKWEREMGVKWEKEMGEGIE